MSKLGKKHHCRKCTCVYYDLLKPEPICPKCGTLQSATARLLQDEPARGRRKKRTTKTPTPSAIFDVPKDLDFTNVS